MLQHLLSLLFYPVLSNVVVSTATVLLFLSWTVCYMLRSPLETLPFPPSPPSKDCLTGHARTFFTPKIWVTYTEWAKLYGNIIHLKAFGKHTIVLNSMDEAVELLEKRSNNYSDRPYIPMVALMAWDFVTGFKSYNGSDWRIHRRFLQQAFKPVAALTYRSKQTEKVNKFLHDLLTDSTNFMAHIRTLSAAIVMSTVYGYDITTTKDHFVVLVEDASIALSESAFPGAAAVNLLPFLRHLPSWFPGTGFKQYANSVVPLVTEMQKAPYEYVQNMISAGTAPPSLVEKLIGDCQTEDDHRTLREVAATVYVAGADTTSSTISTFIHAMAVSPDIQRKAQQELDSIVGNDRLVNYEDQPFLPYIQAIYRESLRWKPVTPLGVFHFTTADDVYKGYLIPKGTTVVANIWAMSRDPVKYDDSEKFNPDRFLDENGNLNDDEVPYVFGFGRRICPGRHMAAATVWLTIATVLSIYNIGLAKDEEGNDIPISGEYTDGLVIQPIPFKCSITPRSTKAKQLVIDSKDGF